ncbi:MAG: DUF1631 family protein [Gammaproteobacteria bacterium]
MTKPPRSHAFALTPEVAADAAALANLVTAAFRLPAAPGQRPITDSELRKLLVAPLPAAAGLADTVCSRLATGETLSGYQYGMLAVVDRILGRFYALPAFHPQLAGLLREYRCGLAMQALPADGWITNPRHPARQLLEALYALACSWQPESGAVAEAAIAQAGQWLSQLAGGDEPGCGAIAAAATQWLAEEQLRRERLEKRLLDAEAGAMRTRRARQLAARTLNQALAGRAIDTGAAHAIREDWFPAMQWVLLHEGEQGTLWQRMKRLTGSLRWTLSPESDVDGNTQLPRLIAQVRGELQELATQVFRDHVARDRLLDAIDGEHLRLLSRSPRSVAPFPPVDADDAINDNAAEVSETLLDGVRALEQGQWLLLREGNGVRRGRLLLRQENSRQVLFANPLGGKAASWSWETCAVRLSNRDALPLPTRAPLQDCVAAVLQDLREQQQAGQQDRIDALRSAREQAAAEVRSREAARQKALAEVQALEKARLAAAQPAASARTADEIKAQDAAQAALQRARLQVSSLTLGTWLVFTEAGGTTIRRRLTVMLPSSGKYIFVDAEGSQKIELARDDLARGLADGRIAPLARDQRLDDTLSRIVENLKQERGAGDKE